MTTQEELFQAKLEMLEAGTPLEECTEGLSAEDQALLRLTVQLQKLPFPTYSPQAVAHQRANLQKLMPLPTAHPNETMNNPQRPQLITVLRPFFTNPIFVGLAAMLLLLFGVWAWNSRSATPTPEVAQNQPTPVAENSNGSPIASPTSIASANESLPTTAAATFADYLPFLYVNERVTPQTAVVRNAHGLVEVQNEAGVWTAVRNGDNIAVGQHIRTHALSSAKLRFNDGSIATLQANTELSLDTVDAYPDAGPRTILLTQWSGESQHDVAKIASEGSRYEVNTPNGSGTAKGTSFQVIIHPNALTYFNVLEGSVAVTNVNVTVIVIAGQITFINPQQPPSEPQFRVTGQGIVTAVGPTWTIGGQLFQTDANTLIVGNPQIGDTVFVAGHLLADGTRMADEIMLLQRPSANQFSLTGPVTAIAATEWEIAGQTITINASTIIEGAAEVGDVVRVEGTIGEDGALVAQHIALQENEEGLPFEFTGVVQTIGEDLWQISGASIVISSETEIEDDIAVGDVVDVVGWIQSNGRWLALSIEKSEDTEPGFTLTGNVQSINPWTVAGIALTTNEETEIEDGIVVNDLVRVEGTITPEGVWLAQEIEKIDDDSTHLILIGTVTSLEPWAVNNIPLITDEDSLIEEGIEVGTLVRVEIEILEDGSWLIIHMQPALPIIGVGCFDIAVSVLSINNGLLTLPNLPSITLGEDVPVSGDLTPGSIVLIRLCFQPDGTIVVVTIIVIYVPPVIVITPEPPQPQPQMVTICHKPGKHQQTMTLPQSALNGHLGHGDTLGACP